MLGERKVEVAAQIAAGRAALDGRDGALRVAVRRDAAPAVAFLVTLGRRDGDIVLPLREGRSLVGRPAYEPTPAPHVVEQAQWFVVCSGRTAHVIDAASTNLSVLVPGARGCEVAAALALAHDTFGWAGMEQLAGAIVLPHLNTLLASGATPAGEAIDVAIAAHARPLEEGDWLRSAYATFAFGWVDGRPVIRAP